MTISKRLTRLRSSMRQEGIDYLVIPTADFHLSEYVGSYFQLRAYLSGFTGSAGTLVVGLHWAGLWTDSRYHIQAKAQLKGTSITLYPVGKPGVPKILAELASRLTSSGTLAVDGRTISIDLGQQLADVAKTAHAGYFSHWQCPDSVWPTRPPLSQGLLSIKKGTGVSALKKLTRLRAHMDTVGAKSHLLSTLDDIAWLLNLRGDDIPHNPVFLSYLWVNQQNAILFIEQCKLSDAVVAYLSSLNITTAPYQAIDAHCQQAHSGRVLVSTSDVNARLYQLLGDSALDGDAFVAQAKAIKTSQEQQHLRNCHKKDACAMIAFLRWVKETVGKSPVSELTAAQHLDALRGAQPGNTGLSFPTISAYAAHGAIVHYGVTPESDIPLEPQGFLLVDSGGQYTDGTTDITRTIALGPLSDEMRRHYTLVLCGMLNLSHAIFPRGTTGATLDALARSPLWAEQLDYGHGTGHGIGFCLNVHEGPQSISHQRRNSPAILPGMVTSDEPGLYIPGAYGIRLENAILCQEAGTSDFGNFLCFETLTLVPFDLDAIDVSVMTNVDCQRLNAYHRHIYETMSPLLSPEDSAWLSNATRAI